MTDGKQISSGMTYFFKNIFPKIWFGFLGVIAVLAILAMIFNGVDNSFSFMALFVFPFMEIMGHLLFKQFCYCLTDEVYDHGDYLRIVNDGLEDKIDMTNIINVSSNMFQSPNIVKLLLKSPSRFGAEISFVPKMRIMALFDDTIAKDLIHRSYKARENTKEDKE